MYRLATLLAVSIMLAAGCGGDSDEGGSNAPSAAVAQSAPGGSRAETSSTSRPSASRDQGEDESEKTEKNSERSDRSEKGSGGTAEKPRNLTDLYEQATPEGRLLAIRNAARGTVEAFGLKFAGVRVRRGGRNVKVLIARNGACRAVAQDEPAMADRLRKAVPIVKVVNFEVAGTGKLLGYYVLGCEQEEIPSGPGTVVLRRTGVGGPVQTKPFKIRGKRWAIEYENGANFLAVLVVGEDAEDEYHKPIGSQKREVGRVEYKTGPGTFQLQIQGGGLWTVRVRDVR